MGGSTIYNHGSIIFLVAAKCFKHLSSTSFACTVVTLTVTTLYYHCYGTSKVISKVTFSTTRTVYFYRVAHLTLIIKGTCIVSRKTLRL